MTETMTELIELIQLAALWGSLSTAQQAGVVIGGLHLLANGIAMFTNTPDPATLWGKAYMLIDAVALNLGKAKDGGSAREALQAARARQVLADAKLMEDKLLTLQRARQTTQRSLQSVSRARRQRGTPHETILDIPADSFDVGASGCHSGGWGGDGGGGGGGDAGGGGGGE